MFSKLLRKENRKPPAAATKDVLEAFELRRSTRCFRFEPVGSIQYCLGLDASYSPTPSSSPSSEVPPKPTMIPRACSDHNPLFGKFFNTLTSVRSFRYLDMWSKHPSLGAVVQSAWDIPVSGGPIRGFSEKLKNVKRKLAIWNKEQFGNIHLKVLEAEHKLLQAEKCLQADHSEDNLKNVGEAKKLLQERIAFDTCFWRQKSKVKWLSEGDANTKYFHAVVKQRRAKSRLSSIMLQDGYICTDESLIAQHGVEFYRALFSGSCQVGRLDFIDDLVAPIVSLEHNDSLVKLPDIEEVKETVFRLDAHSAAGPDGFHGVFYRDCWDVIKEDLHSVVVAFFSGYELPSSWTSALIVTIPKVVHPTCHGVPLCQAHA